MNTTETISHPNETSSREVIIAKLTQIIVDNTTAMLATSGVDHVIRSRPMVNINKQFDGDLYFLHDTETSTCRVDENPQVNVIISEPANGRFASLTGTAELFRDPKKTELLWNHDCEQYFGMSKPSDTIEVIKIDVQDAEYWDHNESLARRFTRLVKRITGSTPSLDVQHDKVDWVEESIHSETASQMAQTLPISAHQDKDQG